MASASSFGEGRRSQPVSPKSQVDRVSGKIKVHNFWAAIDPGIVVQPRNVEAQTKGSIVWALGHVLREQITIKAGHVQQSNFPDYG